MSPATDMFLSLTGGVIMAIPCFVFVVRLNRAQNALRFYADWLVYHRDYGTGKDKSIVECDEGARARRALGEGR